MQTPRQKRRDEQKGFDLLEAIYAEKGLISTGDSSHLMSAKAIGDTRAHSEKHRQEKEKRHRAAFTENPRAHARPERAGFMEPRSEKKGQKHSKLPLQLKKPDIEDPKKGRKK